MNDLDRVATLATNLQAPFQSLALLLVMMDSTNRMLTWGTMSERVRDVIGYTPGSINSAMKRLRAALRSAGAPVHITTQYGIGAVLHAPQPWCEAMLSEGWGDATPDAMPAPEGSAARPVLRRAA